MEIQTWIIYDTYVKNFIYETINVNYIEYSKEQHP